MQKLTEAEKKARGTARKSRALKPRKRSEIRSDMHSTEACIQDMQHNLTEATKEIRTLGMFIETTVTDNNGVAHVVRKLNPAYKIQKDAMQLMKQLRRQLVMLREEEAAATVTEEKSTNAQQEEFTV